jgi:NADH-quinone oxidoreductase subunit C
MNKPSKESLGTATVNCEVTAELRWIEPDQWVSTLTADHGDGFDYLDVLTAIDRPDRCAVEVIAHLMNPATCEGRWRGVAVAAERGDLPTLIDVFVAASWHEREITEMFGVDFVGGSGAPLLHLSPHPLHPLRKDTVLAARAVRPWPGAQDPGSRKASARRRTLPPGVVEGWLTETPHEEATGE